MESATFDIETTSLGAVGSGIILCVCIRSTQTHRVKTFRLDAYQFKPDKKHGFLEREERQLIIDVEQELSKYKILIGHNVERFDWPYRRSRAFHRDVVWNIKPALYDTMRAFRRAGYLTVPNGYGKPTASLAHVVDFFRMKQEKNGVYPVEWWMTIWGNDVERADALNHIVDHCERDVRMNDQIVDFLWAADNRPQIRKTYV